MSGNRQFGDVELGSSGQHSPPRRSYGGPLSLGGVPMSRLKACIRRHDRGAVTAMTGLALVPLLMVSAIVIDGGRVYVNRQRAQTAAEAAALAGATSWARGDAPCGPFVTAMVESNAGGTSAVDCSVSRAPVGGRIDVLVNLPVPTFFSGLLARDSTTVTGQASVRLGGALAVRGLRPMALCIGSPPVSEWIASGYTDTSVKRIPLESTGAGCAGDVTGNWAMLDFNGGSNSTSEGREWIANGYPGAIQVPSTISGEPGIASQAYDFSSVIGKTVVVPLYDRAYSGGSNAQFDLVSFAVIRIVDAKFSGAGSSRYVDLSFQRAPVVGTCCVSEQLNVGALVPQVCSLDGKGVCPL
jgi:Flp pilus assembly protein TadG